MYQFDTFYPVTSKIPVFLTVSLPFPSWTISSSCATDTMCMDCGLSEAGIISCALEGWIRWSLTMLFLWCTSWCDTVLIVLYAIIPEPKLSMTLVSAHLHFRGLPVYCQAMGKFVHNEDSCGRLNRLLGVVPVIPKSWITCTLYATTSITRCKNQHSVSLRHCGFPSIVTYDPAMKHFGLVL